MTSAVETAKNVSVARFMRAYGPVPAPWALETHPAADPRRTSTELGELVGLVFETATVIKRHAFARPFPLLSYHEGGLLISGGAYSVKGDCILNHRSSGPRAPARVPPKDAACVNAAIARYVRDHGGRRGPRTAVRLQAADPRALSRVVAKLVAVIYRTEKGGDVELTDYEHPFSRPRPTLSYHEGGLLISGGVYHVTERGIID